MAHFDHELVSLRENMMELSNGLVWYARADFVFLALLYISVRFSIINILVQSDKVFLDLKEFNFKSPV